MNENKIMLTDEQMANFTAKGYLKLDSVIPEEINKQFLNDIGHTTNELISCVTNIIKKLFIYFFRNYRV